MRILHKFYHVLSLQEFVQNFSDKRLGARVLHQMALVYRNQGRMNKAKRILNSLTAKYPEYDNIPEVLMDLAIVHDNENEFNQAAAIREKVFREYNRDTEWYGTLQSDHHRSRADSI